MIPIIAGFSFSQRKIRRKEFRKTLFETLESRQLFTLLPSLQPPTSPPIEQPPFAQLPSPIPPSDIFGPREQLWISEFDPCIEGGISPARIRIERSNTKPPLEVQWQSLASSSAQQNLDYLPPKPIAKFAPGQSFVDLFFNPIDDAIPEATETIKIILTDASRLGTLLPNEPTILQITDNDSNNSNTFVEWIDFIDGQEGLQPATLRARRTGPLDDELLVPFSVKPQAGLSLEQDFQFARNDLNLKNQTGLLRFPKGSAIASQRWNVVDDATAEGTEWCDIVLLTTEDQKYKLAGNHKKTLRILDNDTPPPDDSPKNGDGTLLAGPYIDRIELVFDSGSSSSDKVTTRDTLQVTYQGDWIGGTLISEFDWNSDGIPELVKTDTSPSTSFEFSPTELNNNEPNNTALNPFGPRTISYRTKLLSDDGTEVTHSPWKTFSYFLVEDPEQGPLRLRNLRLKSDTGSPDDAITNDPTVLVDLYGERTADDLNLPHLHVEWDHSGDGIPDAVLPLPTPAPISFSYDPRSTDQNTPLTPGRRTIRARLFDDRSGERLTAWLSLDFTLTETPSSPLTVDSIRHFTIPETTQNPLHAGILQGSIKQTDTTLNNLTVELDSNLDLAPDAWIEVAEDLTFEHSLDHLPPGRYTFAYRAREWNQSLQCFLHGEWTRYTFDWNPLQVPTIQSIQLRTDTGESSSDLYTGDPALRIEIAPSESPSLERFLDIDTTGNEARAENLDASTPGLHSIRLSEQNQILFINPDIQPGLQRYWFRTRVRNSLNHPTSTNSNSNWESSGDWQVFEWHYQPPSPADIELHLLLDDGPSSSDRITSIPTIVGKLIGDFDEFTTIHVDLGEDEKRPTKIQPQTDGTFTVRLPAAPFGHRTLWVRSERTDPFLATPLLSDWKAFDFELVAPKQQSNDNGTSHEISVRLLVDSGTSNNDRTSNTITLVGNLTQPSQINWVEFDRNGDGYPEDCVATDRNGRFVYMPLDLPFGNHLFALRSKRLADNLETIELGNWQAFDFTYVPTTDAPLRFDTIHLLDDTGIDADRRTENPTITGVISSPTGFSHAIVLVDSNADGIADESVGVDSQGRFIYTPRVNQKGQWSFAFRPLRIDIASPILETNSSTHGTEPWVDFTFEFEDQPNEPPKLKDVLFVPATDGQLPSIRGSVSAQSNHQSLRVELDLNNDNSADRILSVDAYGAFGYVLDNLSEGNSSIQVRVRSDANNATTDLVGSWQSIAVRGEQKPTTAPSILSLTLLDDGNPIDQSNSTIPVVRTPHLSGLVDRLSKNYPLSIEFDSDSDNTVDGQTTVSNDHSFQFIPTKLSTGPFTLRARTKEVLPDGTVLRSPWSSVQGILESNSIGLVTLSALRLANNQGTSDDDQRSDHPVLIGQILGNISRTSQWTLDLDWENGTFPRRSYDFQGPSFSIELPQAQPGIHAVQIRIRTADASKQSSWIPFRFLSHPSPKSPEANAWVAAYRSIASQIASAEDIHVQGLASALSRLAYDRAQIIADREMRNADSFSSRLDSLEELHNNSWKTTIEIDENCRTTIQRSLTSLSESLSLHSINLADYPLEHDLALAWPSTPLPQLPSIDQLIAQAQAKISEPITSSPSLSSLTDPEHQIDLKNYEPYQRELQRLQSEYLHATDALRKLESAKRNESQIHRDQALQIANWEYQETLTRIAAQFSRATKDLLPSGFVEPNAAFVDRSKEVEIAYRTEIQEIQTQFQRIGQAIEAEAAASRQIAIRKRDQARREATQDLQSTLSLIPPPSSTTLANAIKTYAKKFYDADFAFDQDILQIDIEVANASNPLQLERYQAMSAAKGRYLEAITTIEQEQRTSTVEKNHRDSTQRNLADSTSRLAQVAARLKLQLAENKANYEYEKSKLTLEQDYRIAVAREDRQLNLKRSQATLTAWEQLHGLIASSWSSYQLDVARQQVEKLQELEPIDEAQFSDTSHLQLTKQLQHIQAIEIQARDKVTFEAEQTTARIKAIALYRSEHADLVRSYQNRQIELSLNNRKSLSLAQEQLDVDKLILQAETFQLQGKIGRTDRAKRLAAQIYTPPKIDSNTLALGWLGSNPFMWFQGTVNIPWATALSLTLEADNQLQTLNFSYQKTAINLDESYLNQRDQIVENYALESLHNRQSAQTEEQKILKNYHLSTAFIDREFSLSLADSNFHFASKITDLELDEIIGTMETFLRIANVKSGVIAEFKEQERLSRYEWLEQEWNSYGNELQRWHASNPTTWSEYTLTQAEFERTIALANASESYRDEVRKSNYETEKELAIQEQTHRRKLLEQQALYSLRDRDSETHYTLTKERIEATFLFSSQIAGVASASPSNRDVLPPSSINHPWDGPTFSTEDSTLEIKKKIVADTTNANRARASAEVTKYHALSDARFQRDTAIHIASDSLDSNLITWERYIQLLEFANDQFQYSQEAIDTEYKNQLTEINEILRQARAQSVYDLNRVLSLRQIPTAEWSYKSSIPKLLVFQEAQQCYDQAIKDAETKATHENELAQISYRRNLQEIEQQDRQQIQQILDRFELGMEASGQKRELDSQRSRYAIEHSSMASLKNAETNRLATLISTLKKSWEPADSNSRKWLETQADGLQQRQMLLGDSNRQSDLEASLLSIRQTESLQPFQLAHHETTRITAEAFRSQIDGLKLQHKLNQQIAQLQKRSDEESELRDWASAEKAIERDYDLRSQQALDSLNQKLLDSRQQGAELTAQAWRDYYLNIHSPNLYEASQQRSILDNWIGVLTQNSPTSHFAWSQKPILPSIQSLSLSPFLPQNRELEDRLQAIQSTQDAIQTELKIDYLLDLGTVRTQRITAIQNTRAEFSEDRSIAEAEYANTQHALSLNLESALLEAYKTHEQESYELTTQYNIAQHAIHQDFNLQKQTHELEKLQRDNTAFIQFDVAIAQGQAKYWITHFTQLSESSLNLSERNTRDSILAEHALAYSNWIETVSRDWTELAHSESLAKAIDLERTLVAQQEKSNELHEASVNHQIRVATARHTLGQQQHEINFQNQRLQQLQEVERNLEHQQQQYLWEKENLEILEEFQIAYEQAKILDQIMQIRGVLDVDRVRETELLLAKARRDRDVRQAEADRHWRVASAEFQMQAWIDEQDATESLADAKRRVESQTNQQMILADRDYSIAKARIDEAIQTELVSIAQNRSIDLQRARNAWNVATSTAAIAARESIAEVFPNDWSTFLVLRANTLRDDAVAIAKVELDSLHRRHESERNYVQATARSQLEKIERDTLEHSQWELNRLEFEASIDEVRLDAIEDYMNSIEQSLTQTIEQIAITERDYAIDLAEATWMFTQSQDSQKYQNDKEFLDDRRTNSTNQVAINWGKSKALALATRRTQESILEQQTLDWKIDRDQSIASNLRENRYQTQLNETQTYLQAVNNWGEIDRQRVEEITSRLSHSARELDERVQNSWSNFYLEFSYAQADFQRQISQLNSAKNSNSASIQAEHETQQAASERLWDLGQWLVSGVARITTATFDRTLEETKIAGLRTLTNSGWVREIPLFIEMNPQFTHSTRTEFAPNLSSVSFRADHREDITVFVDQRIRDDLIVGIALPWEKPTVDVFRWKDNGFLRWLRDPLEQWPTNYWNNLSQWENPLVDQVGDILPENTPSYPISLQLNTFSLLPTFSWLSSTVSSPHVDMMPQKALSDRLTIPGAFGFDATTPIAKTWLETNVQQFEAAQRPEFVHEFNYADLLATRTIAWPTNQPPTLNSAEQPISTERFYVSNEDQWNTLIGLLSEPSAQTSFDYQESKRNYAADSPLAVLTNKLREHIQEKTFNPGSYRDQSTIRRAPLNDDVIRRNNDVYWRWVFPVSSPIELGQYQYVETKIGTVDQHGWVYLQTGKRVLYSALHKWAGELRMGNAAEINRLIDGLISPYVFDPTSKQYGIFIGGTGMHFYGLGNIEKLYNAYQGSKFYYGGIGNPIEYENYKSLWADQAAGFGWSSILKRIEADFVTFYRPKQKIHVFGWSRGAALAHEFSKILAIYNVEVDFLGLFDPVYSYVFPGQSSTLVAWSQSGRDGNYINVEQTRNAKAITALYAANEDRSFFPASRFYSDGVTKMRLMMSPGGHGEVGGHFESNPIVQQLNLKAMMEFAELDGKAQFLFHGIDEDIASIFDSPITEKIALNGIPIEDIEASRSAYRTANSYKAWVPLTEQQYQNLVATGNARDWAPGGFGAQRGNWSGLIVSTIDFGVSILPPWFNTEHRQSISSHYPRYLHWCTLHLWSVPLMLDEKGLPKLTPQQLRILNHMYSLRIDPVNGYWEANQ